MARQSVGAFGKNDYVDLLATRIADVLIMDCLGRPDAKVTHAPHSGIIVALKCSRAFKIEITEGGTLT